MQTETYLTIPAILVRMGEFLQYATAVETAKIGEDVFDVFIDNLVEEMRKYDSINPYDENPFGHLDEKVDSFLKKHCTINYKSFVNRVNIDGFNEGDYNLPTPSLKRRLFRLKSRLYLAAIGRTEEAGYSLNTILESITPKIIPYIKKTVEEPTWAEILKLLSA